MKKVTKKDIDRNNMVVLSCYQCINTLNFFGANFKVGSNYTNNRWVYDLYNINGVNIVMGYNAPHKKYSNEVIKNKLLTLEEKIRYEVKYSLTEEKFSQWKKEFLNIFK